MPRGVLPRSFRIDPTDPLYGTPLQTNAYAYDNALALIGTAKPRPPLANEILEGIFDSITYPSTLPFISHFNDGSAVGATIQNNAVAMMAYALGYWMEMNPSSLNYCTAEEYLRNMLSYLNGERNWVECYGLIVDGRDISAILTEGVDFILTEDDFGILVTENSLASMVKTEDNLLAWYAFKQAAKIFNEPLYQTTADELQTAIMEHLWSVTESKFWFGLTTAGSPVSYNALYVSAYGALFMNEIGESVNSLLCLAKCEVFKCIDDVEGVIGYKTFISFENTVNFEMSYAVALAYLRNGNDTKCNQIRNELNRFIDPIDGGQIGALVKNYLDDDLTHRKAVGSTAWTLIAMWLESTAFTIRSNVFTPVASCSTFWFNEMQHYVFTKEGCPVDSHGSTYDYIVPAGRYVSYISQDEANDLAFSEIDAQGQDYVNANGMCIPDAGFGNVFMSGFFLNQTCPLGTTPTTAVTFNVPANSYYASTQVAADALADAYLQSAGQAYANSTGPCSSASGPINIWITWRHELVGTTYTVYTRAWSSAPLPINARVYYQIWADTTPGAPVISTAPFLQFTAGDTQTPEKNAGSFTDAGLPEITAVITSVVPNHYGSTLFTW